MDKILINNLKVSAKVGIYAFEKENPQVLDCSLEVKLNLTKSKQSDNLEDTVDYGQLVAIIKKIAISKQFNLLEHLAQTIINVLQAEFKRVQHIKISLLKPTIIEGCEGIGVSIES